MATQKLISRRFRPPAKDPHSYSSLVAAATRLDVKNRAQARQIREYKQGWQSDAWAYRDSIGELRYAGQFLAMCAARMRLYPAIYTVGSETDEPVPMHEMEAGTIPSSLPGLSEELMSILGRGKYALSNLMKHLSTNWTFPGEAFLLGREDQGEEDWTIRSADEVVVLNDKYYLRETPTDPQGVHAWEELPPDVVLVRLWSPHPRFRELADSPVRPILEECESLLIHRRTIRAVGRSRIAGRGILFIPEEMSIKVPNEDDDDPESDPFFSQLAQVLMAPIADEGVASAVVPAVIRGPAEQGQHIQHIDLAGKFDEASLKIREELVGVIASGLDLPKEVVMGAADLNHWSAWQVEDNTFRHHIEPHVTELCEAITGSYFRPALEDAGVPQAIARRCLIWYDPSELVTHPDQTSDAKDLYDRHAISAEALARVAGFSESDMPTPEETVIRMLQNMRTPPANLVMAAVHQMFPALTIPPIETSGTVPGVKPSGVDPGEPPPEQGASPALPPATATDEAPPAAEPDAEQDPNKVPPPPAITSSAAPMPPNLRKAGEDTTHSCATCRMFDAGVCWGYGNRPVEDSDVCDSWAEDAETAQVASGGRDFAEMGRKLMLVDRDLRNQLQSAASSAVMRQLERAGAKLRTKVAKDETLRATIEHKRNDRVPAYLGEAMVASMGVSTSELISGDWDSLRSQFLESVASAQKRIVRILEAEGMRKEVSDKLYDKLKLSRQPAWEAFASDLTEVAHKHLYSPDPNRTVREWGDINPHTIVPAGIVRGALTLAGGKGVLTAAGGDYEPSEIEGGSSFQPAGQLSAGEAVQEALSEEGVEAQTYTWVHGPSLKPFEPHLELDGAEFTSFEDDRLVNSEGWPDRDHFMPGDHQGCMCDFEVGYGCSGITSDGGEGEGMCGGAEAGGGSGGISEEQSNALSNYVAGSDLNEGLRGGNLVGDWRLKEADAISAAIRSSPLPEDTVLYRGGGVEYADLRPGQVYTDQGFCSTSAKMSFAESCMSVEGSPVLIRINAPEGTPGLPLDDALKEVMGADEVLLDRGSTFEVLTVESDEDGTKLIEVRVKT